jgi:GrpB-like predicted nucleotidyltransferase (UPF0157 family)
MRVPPISRRRIEIADFNPAWPVLFGVLGQTLRRRWARWRCGLTTSAQPRWSAWPIIDVQISVAGFEPIEAFTDPLEQLGYVCRADNPERTKRYFREAAGRIFTSGALEAFPSKYRR